MSEEQALTIMRERAERAESDRDEWMEKAVHLASKIVKVRELLDSYTVRGRLWHDISRIVDGENA